MTTSGTVGLAEAKNKLSELLDRVQRGEEFTITRHGEAIARLVPAKHPNGEGAKKVFEAIEAMRRLRASNPSRVTLEDILAWKKHGRK